MKGFVRSQGFYEHVKSTERNRYDGLHFLTFLLRDIVWCGVKSQTDKNEVK